jgi:hypothetical protein
LRAKNLLNFRKVSLNFSGIAYQILETKKSKLFHCGFYFPLGVSSASPIKSIKKSPGGIVEDVRTRTERQGGDMHVPSLS